MLRLLRLPATALLLVAALAVAGCSSQPPEKPPASPVGETGGQVTPPGTSKEPGGTGGQPVSSRNADPQSLAEVVARLNAAGIEARATGEVLPLPLFGALAGETVQTGPLVIQVYTFASNQEAEASATAASDPQKNTISWVAPPHVVVVGSALVTVVTADEALAGQIVKALQTAPDQPAAAPLIPKEEAMAIAAKQYPAPDGARIEDAVLQERYNGTDRLVWQVRYNSAATQIPWFVIVDARTKVVVETRGPRSGQ